MKLDDALRDRLRELGADEEMLNRLAFDLTKKQAQAAPVPMEVCARWVVEEPHRRRQLFDELRYLETFRGGSGVQIWQFLTPIGMVEAHKLRAAVLELEGRSRDSR